MSSKGIHGIIKATQDRSAVVSEAGNDPRDTALIYITVFCAG